MSELSNCAHPASDVPSAWVVRWGRHVAPVASVLDVACGTGRHARYFAQLGHTVKAVDRDEIALAALAGWPAIDTIAADIEAGPWPYPGQVFSLIVVTNYLHRPLLPVLVDAVAPGGILLYETFAQGNERFGRPSNPAFLLRPGELLEAVRGKLRVIAYEDVRIDEPRPAMVQRICALRASNGGD